MWQRWIHACIANDKSLNSAFSRIMCLPDLLADYPICFNLCLGGPGSLKAAASEDCVAWIKAESLCPVGLYQLPLLCQASITNLKHTPIEIWFVVAVQAVDLPPAAQRAQKSLGGHVQVCLSKTCVREGFMVSSAGSGLSAVMLVDTRIVSRHACFMLVHTRRRHRVQWIEDPSNANLRFDRARMRKVGACVDIYMMGWIAWWLDAWCCPAYWRRNCDGSSIA